MTFYVANDVYLKVDLYLNENYVANPSLVLYHQFIKPFFFKFRKWFLLGNVDGFAEQVARHVTDDGNSVWNLGWCLELEASDGVIVTVVEVCCLGVTLEIGFLWQVYMSRIKTVRIVLFLVLITVASILCNASNDILKSGE